jgi:hypothetical protein
MTFASLTGGRAAAVGPGDSAAAAYMRERLVLTDRAGSRLVLRWQGYESRGDALIIGLSGHAPTGLRGVAARNTILCE